MKSAMIKITREELYNQVWTKPMVKLAAEYKLSDNGLRKICKKHNIPIPPMGYWQKIQYGKKVNKTLLPKSDDNEVTISISENKPATFKDNKLKDFLDVVKTNKKLVLIVPDRLSKPDSITVELQQNLKSKNPSDYGLPIGAINTSAGLPDVIVTPKNLSRTLRILDVIFKNLRKLGFTISFKDKRFEIKSSDDESLTFSIKEKSNVRQINNKYGWQERQLIPNGKLSLKVYLFGETEYIDKENNLLENQIPKFLAKILSGIDDARERTKSWKIQREEMELARKIEQEKQTLREKELNRFIDFHNQAHRWKKYMILKEYLEYLDSQDNSIERREWIEWAKIKLEWYDPTSNKEDDLLKDVDKDTLEFKKKQYFW